MLMLDSTQILPNRIRTKAERLKPLSLDLADSGPHSLDTNKSKPNQGTQIWKLLIYKDTMGRKKIGQDSIGDLSKSI